LKSPLKQLPPGPFTMPVYTFLKYAIIFGLLLFNGTVISVAVYFLNTSYNVFTDLLIALYHLQDRAELFRTSFITPQRYIAVRYLLLVVALFVPMGSLLVFLNLEKFYYVIYRLLLWVQSQIRIMLQTVDQWGKWERQVVGYSFLLIGLIRVAAAFWFPVHTDEAFSYVNFVEKGVLVSWFYYPGPNNHVLFSLISALLTNVLPNSVMAMRLTAIFFGIAFLCLGYLVGRKFLGFPVAYITMMVYAFSEHGFFYGVHGRGYSLMIFLMFLSGFSLIQVLRGRSRFYYFLLIFSSALGLLTIPVFVLPLSALVMIGVLYCVRLRHWSRLRWLFTAWSIAALLTFLGYLPVMIGSGYEALFSNSWIAPQPSQTFWGAFGPYLYGVMGALYPVPPMGVVLNLLLLLISMVVVFWPKARSRFFGKHDKRLGWLAILYLIVHLTAILVLAVLQVMPAARVMAYLVPFQLVLLVLLVAKLAQKAKIGFSSKAMYLAMAATCCLLWFWHNIYEFNAYLAPYREAKALKEMILEHPAGGEQNILIVDNLFYTLFSYEIHQSGLSHIIDYKARFSADFYNLLILPAASPLPREYRQEGFRAFHNGAYFTAYRR